MWRNYLNYDHHHNLNDDHNLNNMIDALTNKSIYRKAQH